MREAPDWTVEGRDWPHRGASQFVSAGGLRWHVQVMGEGPALLLLHGTGAATHSWRGLAPLLAQTFTIIAPDLPGHGFTDAPARASDFGLPEVAGGVRALLNALGSAPDIIVGHSAGAAVAARMALDAARVRAIVAINGALKPLPGMIGPWARATARMMLLNPFALQAFAARAERPGAVADLMQSTGSIIDAEGLSHYAALFQTRRHLSATINLMAHWDLETLAKDLPALQTPVALIAGERDRAVPPDAARWAHDVLPHARAMLMRGVGHLAHEEAPEAAAALIQGALEAV
ncbi:MAG: alpha/beta fold hydrolase [Alphaproteobacteria bacterium]|nr:alpha/beta fold hydrolase [Alphaproteobacteria bacterium]